MSCSGSLKTILVTLFFACMALGHTTSTSKSKPLLEIPIRSALDGHVFAYTNHPSYPLFQLWNETAPHLQQFATSLANDLILPERILCGGKYGNDCLFETTVSIPRAAYGLTRRSDAGYNIISTHWKTYWGAEGSGAEHYTDWNLFCGRLSYRGGVLKNQFFDGSGGVNSILTRVYVSVAERVEDHYPYEYKYHTVVLEQRFRCTFWGNRCCVTKEDRNAWRYDGVPLGRWTWDCSGGAADATGAGCQG